MVSPGEKPYQARRSVAIVIAAVAFVAHPSSWLARFTPVATPSRTLSALAAIAAVPRVIYAIGQLDIHLGSGPHDEHYEFGHWVVMAVNALLVPLFGAVAAWKVSGWRFPLRGAAFIAVGELEARQQHPATPTALARRPTVTP